MEQQSYHESSHEAPLRAIYHRRPSSLVRFRHGGYGALYPLHIDGVLPNILNPEIDENFEATLPAPKSAKIIDLSQFRKKSRR